MKINSWSSLAKHKPGKAGFKRNQFSRPQLLLFVLVFGVIGIVLIKTFAAPNPNLPGDLNGDNTVNVTDMSILLSNYGTANTAADINSDGTVNVLDLSILLSHYGQTVTASKPAIPSGLTATAGDTKVTLSWSANASTDAVDTYQVYWTTDSTWANSVQQNLSVTGTTFAVTGLTNGTAYYFRISAHNSVGYGDWSTTPVTATPAGASGGGTTSGSGNGIGMTIYGGNLHLDSDPSRFGMVVVSIGDADAACALPSTTRSLIYMAGTDVNQSYFTGVDWSTANANGWLLKDSGGNLLVNQGYTSNNIGDVGSSAYQQAWITGVTNYAAAHNCHGVFIDDVLRDIKGLSGVYPAKYPSQSAWQSAMASFVSAVGPGLKAKGIYVAINAVGFTSGDGNSNDGTLDVQWWQQLGPSVSGLMNESYAETSDGNNTLRLSGSASYTQFWDGWQRLIGTAQSMNRDFIGLTYGASNTDYQHMRYGRGSFLLEWNGGGSTYMYSPSLAADPWNTVWTSDMGQPTGAKTQVSTGIWQRAYTKGTVIVNTTSATVTVSGHSVASADAYYGP